MEYREILAEKTPALPLVAVLALIAALALVLPYHTGIDSAAYLPLHSAMEVFSVVVASLVFTSAFNSYRANTAANLVLLASIFLVVALLDFAHLLSYPGMPDFVTPNNPAKAIHFWLAARIGAALALLVVAVQPWQAELGRRAQMLTLAAALAFAAGVSWIILFHPSTLPGVIDEDGGLTPFKRGMEYLVILIHALTAAIFYRRKGASLFYDAGLLFAAVAVMGLGELFFTAYLNASDLTNLLGHIYKIAAYYLLYRAVFAHSIRAPFHRMVESERSLRASEERYRVIVETSAEGIWLIDQNQTTVYANQKMAQMLGIPSASQMIGCPIAAFMDEQGQAIAAINLERLQGEGSRHLDFEFRRPDGQEFWASLSISPIFQDGEYVGALAMVTDITERIRASRKIAELQYRNELILDTAGDGICGIDEAGGIVFINPAAARMLGYDGGELLGRSLHDVSHHTRPNGSPYPADECPILGALVHGAHFHETSEYFWRRDGSLFPVEYTCTPIPDPETPIRMVVMFSDISARKQAEEALRQSEARFRTLYGSIQDAVYVLPIEIDGRPGKFIEVNEIACRMLGYTRQELLGMGLPEVDDPVTGVNPDAVIERLMAGESAVFEQVHLAKDGRRIPVEVNANPFILEGKHVVMSLVRDITERKRMEAALRASEDRFRNIFEQAEVGMVQTAPDGTFLRVNRKFCQIVGYAREELYLMSFKEITHPDDLEQDLAYLEQMAHGEIDTFSMEKRYLRKDGGVIWVSLSVSPFRDEGGAIKYFIGAIKDVSLRKLAEQRLRELSAHLQTVREEEKASIAREIHDDLGGTLTALKMDVYWLGRKMPAGQQFAPLLERMESMSQLLDNAVGVTRRIITELRPTILDDLGLLAALEWQAAQFAKRTGIECRVTCSVDQGQLDKMYAIALFRIFQEALTNVSRHAGASRVDVEFRHDDQAVTLVVHDNGRGLGDKPSQTSDRYGIRGMLERATSLGGVARIDSPPEGGLTITTILPLKPVIVEDQS